MANNVKIGGVTVDADDPCALWTALYNVKLKMMAGENVGEVMIGDLATQRRTRFNQPSMTAITAELARLKDLCQQATGAKKARFAIRAGFRSS